MNMTDKIQHHLMFPKVMHVCRVSGSPALVCLELLTLT